MTQQQRSIAAFEATVILSHRVGIEPWERLNWFVEMAQKDLHRMSEGERLSLREEIAALDKMTDIASVPASELTAPLPDWDMVKKIQKKTFQLLGKWVDKGEVVLGPFGERLELKRPASPIDLLAATHLRLDPKRQVIPGQEPLGHSARYHLPDTYRRVLFQFSGLMRDHASAIVRCLHCHRIFLKLRKHARYCSRKCHSVAGMREKREREKQRRDARKRSVKKGLKTRRKEKR